MNNKRKQQILSFKKLEQMFVIFAWKIIKWIKWLYISLAIDFSFDWLSDASHVF